MKTKLLTIFVAASLLIFLSGGLTGAAVITLTDYNSSASINTSTGMYDWTVDGVDHMWNQWFYYQIGDGASASIGTLPLLESSSDGNDADLSYGNDFFTIDVSYTLYGGSPGSGISDMAESIRIINICNEPLDFHFFQYTDFDLGATITDTGAMLANANTVVQWDESVVVAETVVTPSPNYWQIGYYPDVLNSLGTNLTNATSPLYNGDLEWAFQWDRTLAAGGSFVISKDKLIGPVPEPMTMLLLGLGLLGVGLVRRMS